MEDCTFITPWAPCPEIGSRSRVRSESFRVVVVYGRCHAQLRLCGRCDRSRRFCPPCSVEQRRDSIRRAGAAYRVARRARRLHATRQARYRDRHANFSAQKVTHQSVTQAAATRTDSVVPEPDSGGKDREDVLVCDQGRCSLCGAALPPWTRRSSAPGRGIVRRAPRLPRAPPPR